MLRIECTIVCFFFAIALTRNLKFEIPKAGHVSTPSGGENDRFVTAVSNDGLSVELRRTLETIPRTS